LGFEPLPQEFAVDRKCVGVALDCPQALKLNMPAQWERQVPASVDRLTATADGFDQFFVGFFHE
jgi:hypothetical protein